MSLLCPYSRLLYLRLSPSRGRRSNLKTTVRDWRQAAAAGPGHGHVSHQDPGPAAGRARARNGDVYAQKFGFNL
jgi:hypothetical protein